MQRSGRRLFNAIATLSTVLFVLATALWVRSLRRSDDLLLNIPWKTSFHIDREVEFLDDGPHTVSLPKLEGRSIDFRSMRGAAVLFMSYRDPTVPAAIQNPPARQKVQWGSSPDTFLPLNWTHFRFDHYSSAVERDSKVYVQEIAFSYEMPEWTLVIAFAVVPIIWLWKRMSVKRITPGYCSACGYDLRATPGRCPECGKLEGSGVGGV
jgi:hypothetical protein